jgi:hypothetical protein
MIETDLFARVSSGDRGSDTVMVHVRQPVFLASLEVTARYPAYLGLEDEPLPTVGDTVLLPAGTRLETRGEATAELGTRRGALARPSALPVNGSSSTASSRRFARALTACCGRRAVRRWLATRSCCASHRCRQRAGARAPGAVPTTASPDARALIVIDAHDDHGLSSVVLELRRVSVSAPPIRWSRQCPFRAGP